MHCPVVEARAECAHHLAPILRLLANLAGVLERKGRGNADENDDEFERETPDELPMASSPFA